MYVAITNIVETMCQNIQCIVSKLGVEIREASINILVMFRVKNIATAVRIAANLIFGLMSAVERRRAKRR